MGYKTYTLTEEYNLIGVCFDGIGGTEIDINQAFPYSEGMTKEYLMANADQIQVMGDDHKYSYYFLSNGKYGKGGKSYNADLDGKWIETAGVPCEAKVKAGQAFWYISRKAKETPHTITVAGQVLESSATGIKDCSETYSLYSNPFAVPVKLNEGGIEMTAPTKEYLMANADQIQVMGDDQKYTYYFLSNGKYGKGGKSYDEKLDGKWLETAGVACDAEIPGGCAFWYISRNLENTIKLINPLAK